MVDEDGSAGMSLVYHHGSRYANGRIYREKSVGVGSDGMIKIVFLDLLYSCFG